MMSKVNNIAHRLVPLCLLLVALAGCRKEDTPAPDTPSGTPIAFTPETATKAAVSGVEDIQNDPNGFRVWSWFKGTTSGPMFGADGTQVTYDTATSAWTYSPTRYWMNGIYNFAAVYPASVSATYAATDGALALTVADFDVTDQHDLLVAFNNGTDGTGINGATPPSVVNLNFKHALTKINLKISQNLDKDKTNEYKITKVRISGIKNIGSFTANDNSSFPYNWEISNTSVISFEKTFDDPVLLQNESNQGVAYLKVWGEDGILLIPQEVGANALQILIEFDYVRGEYVYKRFITDYIPEDKLWESGKAITYAISISQEDNITFLGPTIEPWSDRQTGSTIIIQ